MNSTHQELLRLVRLIAPPEAAAAPDFLRHLARLDELAATPGLDRHLAHYLQNRSYQKARAWLESHSAPGD